MIPANDIGAIEGLPVCGVARAIPDTQYHAKRIGVVSKSALDLIARSPEHYKSWVDGKLDKDTAALTFGRWFHSAMLEPEKFSRYVAEPDFGDMRRKENKADRAKWLANYDGFETIPADDFETITNMVAKVRAHPLAGGAIRNGIPELTITWRDEETGLPCKSRIDYYVESLAMAVDVKSTEDASHNGFRHSIEQWRYHVQDALYRFGLAANDKPIQHFVFLAVEKKPPYGIGCYTLDAEDIGRGYSRARADIETLAECLRTNRWPSYPEEIVTIKLRPWAA